MGRLLNVCCPLAPEPMPKAVKVEVHHRRGIEGEHLADHEPTDDSDAQRPAKFGTDPSP